MGTTISAQESEEELPLLQFIKVVPEFPDFWELPPPSTVSLFHKVVCPAPDDQFP